MKVFIGKYPGPRSKKERVIKIELHKYDAWNADHTLALIIHPLLVKLKECKHGAPFTNDEDVPEELRSTSIPPVKDDCEFSEFARLADDSLVDDNHFKRWDWIMDEMIWTFNELAHNENIDYEWDVETRKAYYDRIHNGLRLFGKHFRDLWD